MRDEITVHGRKLKLTEGPDGRWSTTAIATDGRPVVTAASPADVEAILVTWPPGMLERRLGEVP